MNGLTVHHFRFTAEAQTSVELGPQAGGQLRGALYDALRQQSCPAPGGIHDPGQAEWCPVCRLMAREDGQAVRGKDVPRAFAVQPPLDSDRHYAPGQRFHFGISLFGDAIAIFPYIVLALPLMGQTGVGYGRGQFVLRRITAHHPLTGEIETLLNEGESKVRRPVLCVTADQVRTEAADLPTHQIALRFLTPTRLTDGQTLVHHPVFRVLIARLLERFDTLNKEYGDGYSTSPWESLVPLAGAVRLVEDLTRWVDVFSGSRRRGYATPISGFVGTARFEGDLAPFREWLLWGQSLQVGKNVVKGDGLYEIVRE